MNSAVEFNDVDILFAQEGRDGRKSLREALAALDGGGTRTDIQKKCGVIVGVAGANLSVAQGEISVLMGLSGSGKSTLLRAANGLNPVTRGHVWVRDGDSAVIVPVGDVEALAEALERVATDSGLRERLRRGGDLVARAHSWDRSAIEHEHAYARSRQRERVA